MNYNRTQVLITIGFDQLAALPINQLAKHQHPILWHASKDPLALAEREDA